MKMRKLLGSCLALAMFFSIFGQVNIIASIATPTNKIIQPTESKYMESRVQINFTNMDLKVSKAGELILTEKSGISSSQRNTVNQDIAHLKQIMEEFPEVEDHLIKDIQSTKGELCAVSFTRVPLMEVDGHYERVPVSNARAYEAYEYSKKNGKGTFLLYTTISGGYKALAGDYEYVAMTHGTWSNSFLGGYNYPAGYHDYVFQTCPDTFSRQSDTMRASYNTSPIIGVNGDDYWREDGDSTYVRYAIQDDPFGYRQLTRFTLTTTSAGPASNKLRQIASYYIHTWQAITLGVSIEVSNDKGVSLSFTPAVEDKSWQVYNYVSFDF